MTSTNDSDLTVAAPRQASFFKGAEPAHEFSIAKLVILVTIFFITVPSAVALLVMR